MCFSATASFIAGGVLSLGGVSTINKTKSKREVLFASIPLFFGIQQLIEGVVWVSFNHPLLNSISVYLYAFFSHVFWPVFIPISVLMIETNQSRRKYLRFFSLIGVAVGTYFSYIIIQYPVSATIINDSISYNIPHFYVEISLFFYIVAICVSCFFSSFKIIKLFGMAIFVSAVISTLFFSQRFLSVWCFFAAILSVIIYWHFAPSGSDNIAVRTYKITRKML